MAARVEIVGDPAKQLRQLGRDLALAGPKMRRKVTANLKLAARPALEEAKRNAARLPSGGGRGVRSYNRKTGVAQKKLKTKGFANRGGKSTRVESLASRVANANYQVRIRTSGRSGGVQLRGTDKAGRSVDLNKIDGGTVRHPVFGNRNAWVEQSVPANFWTDAMATAGPAAKTAVIAAVDTAIAEIGESLF